MDLIWWFFGWVWSAGSGYVNLRSGPRSRPAAPIE